MSFTRKEFLNTLINLGGLCAAALFTYPIFSYLKPLPSTDAKVNTIKAGAASEFPFNSSQIIKFGRKPVILIKSETGKFSAFDATCTHLDCIVQYKKETKQILCACHNGIFDINGQNLSCPPPKPLQEYLVKIIDDEIIITSVGS